jgi:hypothetical protein
VRTANNVGMASFGITGFETSESAIKLLVVAVVYRA